MKNVEVVAAIIQNEDKFLATKRGYGEFKGLLLFFITFYQIDYFFVYFIHQYFMCLSFIMIICESITIFTLIFCD